MASIQFLIVVRTGKCRFDALSCVPVLLCGTLLDHTIHALHFREVQMTCIGRSMSQNKERNISSRPFTVPALRKREMVVPGKSVRVTLCTGTRIDALRANLLVTFLTGVETLSHMLECHAATMQVYWCLLWVLLLCILCFYLHIHNRKVKHVKHD